MLCVMGKRSDLEEIDIKIKTLVHKSTGALMAVSDDLPGLWVAGATYDEIEGKLEAAIRDHYDLLGRDVVSIALSSEDGDIAGFESTLHAFVAHASLGGRHAA
jgi:hypothetical protein